MFMTASSLIVHSFLTRIPVFLVAIITANVCSPCLYHLRMIDYNVCIGVTSKEPVCPRVELILKIIIILLIIFLGFIKSKPC